MIDIVLSTLIKQPIEVVFAFLVQPENETQWQDGLVESKLTSQGPIAIGTTGRDVRRFMGRETVTTWQVTAFEPNRKMSFKVVSGPMPFEGSYEVEAVGDSTRLVYLVQANTGGIAKLFDPLVTRLVRSQGEKQMSALKSVLEAEA